MSVAERVERRIGPKDRRSRPHGFAFGIAGWCFGVAWAKGLERFRFFAVRRGTEIGAKRAD